MALISGTLKDPIGNIAVERVRITCLEGEGDVLTTAQAVITPESNGDYSFELLNGDFEIEYYQECQWNSIGKVRVTEATSDSTINELIDNNTIPPV